MSRHCDKPAEQEATPTLASELANLSGLSYWERTAGFRESTLQLFPKKEAKALRRIGHLLFYLVTEVDLPDPNGPRFAALARVEVEAAMVDLRSVQSFLVGISRQIDDIRLAAAAGEAAGNLTPVLAALAKVLQ